MSNLEMQLCDRRTALSAIGCAALGALLPKRAAAKAAPVAPESWTLAILPDTQHYSQRYPQHFHAQTQWIKDNAEKLKIKYVLHEGDIVNVAADNKQWVNSRAALDRLNGFVPYAIAPGNHDYRGQGQTRDTFFDDGVDGQNYYGKGTPYAEQPSIGGFYEEPGKDKTDNSWHTFNANGQDWLILALEWGPREGVVEWANQIASDHSDHNMILLTHCYMYNNDKKYDWAKYGEKQNWSPHRYGVAKLPGGVHDGQELWDNLVKKHKNMKLVFNGHVLGDGTGFLSSKGEHGNVVHQMLANYQFKHEGGDGDMRLLEFNGDGNSLNVRTYSPVLDRFDQALDQQFSLKNGRAVRYAAHADAEKEAQAIGQEV
jgi:hypothetical protein